MRICLIYKREVLSYYYLPQNNEPVMYELSLYMSTTEARLWRPCRGSTGRIGLICITSAVGEDELPASRCDLINPGESGFGGLEVACWSLVPKFAGSNPAEAV